MATMRPPQVPETPPPVFREEELRRLLEACAGTSFEDRRDSAILRLFIDTGMRRAELAGLKLEDVDFDHEMALVMGKGRRRGPAPSATRPDRPWTATCVFAPGAPMLTSPGCGSASAGG